MKLHLVLVVAAASALAAEAFPLSTAGVVQKPAPVQKPRAKSPPPTVKYAPAKTVPAQPGVASSSSGSGGSHVPFVGPNDNCAAATAISGGGPFAFDNTGANTDGPLACGNFQADVWFNWTSGAAGLYDVTLCGGASFDTEVAVYDTSACVGTQLACNDDSCGLVSKASFTAVASHVYKIRIGGYNGANGTGTFTVTQPPPPPANDSCAAPTAISGGGPFPWSNLSATTDGPAESCGTPNQDVWYTWVAPTSGTYLLDLCAGTPSTTDTVVAVYAATTCPPIAFSAIACDDDFCSFAGPSKATFSASGGSTYLVRIGGYAGAEGSGTFTLGPPPPPPANDDCSTPSAISGGGPFPFDNTAATTGTQGQSNSLCNAFGTMGIDNDVWYTWTAGSTGVATLSLCNQATMDSKVAVYTGTGCPAGQAIACDDDFCYIAGPSQVCFPAVSGQAYTIQLGNYPTAGGGTGTFTISVVAGGPCQYDDGSSEDMYGWPAGGDMAWLQAFGDAGGGSQVISSVQVAYGSPSNPGHSPANGSPARVAIWEDPNDDGDPSDAVLLQVVNTTVANVDTDQMNTVSIPSASVSGVFFIGVSEVHPAGDFVAVMDTSGCLTPGRQWFFGNDNATPADLVNVNNNAHAPASFDSIGRSCNLLIRGGCAGSAMATFCLPGQNGVHACPCSNPPAGTGLGCNNFGAGPADSGRLDASGSAIVANDTLVFTASGENNTAFTIIAQGTAQLPAGVVFGAGVRCVAGTLKRLYSGPAGSAANGDPPGTIHRPGPADSTPVHTASANKGYVIVPPITLYYFAYYRDPGAAGPCGNPTATFNSTQAGAVTWQ
jgi:hypothetical protein